MAEQPDFADFLAIQTVKARYCYLLDTKDWEGWKRLFTEDCRFDTTGSGGSVVEGRDAMAAFTGASLADAKTAHHVHSPIVEMTGADEARVIWAMQDRVVKGEFALTGYGHYHERYVRTGEGWKIAEQVLTRLHMDIVRPAS
jgi:hypothetical protein